MADEATGCVTGNSTNTPIQTWHLGTHIQEGLTVSASEGTPAYARIVIDELDAIQAAFRVAGVGEALVDISFTTLTGKARKATAGVAPNLIHALPTVEAMRASCIWSTVINILFTPQASSAWWTGTLEMVHQVNASPSILAWLVLAFIYLIFTVDSLVSWYTLTSISSNIISTSGSMLAGIGGTFIQLFLTVAARVAQRALAMVSVASIDALPRVLTQAINRHFSAGCSHLTGDIGHITISPSPARRTQTLGLCFSLSAGAFIFTR